MCENNYPLSAQIRILNSNEDCCKYSNCEVTSISDGNNNFKSDGNRNSCSTLRKMKELGNLVCSEPINMKVTSIKRDYDEGPIGRITRNQDFDIIGSKYVYACHCGSRNGLDVECKRISCQGGNPGCKMNPPRCWPRYCPPPATVRETECPVRLCYLASQSHGICTKLRNKN